MALEELGITTKVLILAPKSVLPVWYDELAERGIDSVIIEGTPKAKKKKLSQDCVHIITYESSWRGLLDPRAYQVIVFDEAIKLQNGLSKLGKFWGEAQSLKLLKDTRLWGLSGAPCPEGALQLANQQLILEGEWFNQKDYAHYVVNYWDWETDDFKYYPKSLAHPKEAVNAFRAGAHIISQKDLKMGAKSFELRRVKASREEEALLVSNMEGAANMGVRAAYAQAACSGINAETKTIVKKPSKLLAVIERVKDLLEEDPNTQVVVIHRFTVTGEWLSRELNCPWIYGQTSSVKRDAIIKSYQSGKNRVVVGQADAIKMGVDFSAGGHGVLVYAEHSWSGDSFIQSTQRAVNIERATPALIITYCLDFEEYTVDEDIYETVKSKRDFNAKMLKTKKDK